MFYERRHKKGDSECIKQIGPSRIWQLQKLTQYQANILGFCIKDFVYKRFSVNLGQDALCDIVTTLIGPKHSAMSTIIDMYCICGYTSRSVKNNPVIAILPDQVV